MLVSRSVSFISTETPCSDIAGRANAMISRIASLMSRFRLWVGANLEKSRIRLTISATRLTSSLAFLEVRRLTKPPRDCSGLYQSGANGLADFMRERSRELSHGRDPVGVGQLRRSPAQSLFALLQALYQK